MLWVDPTDPEVFAAVVREAVTQDATSQLEVSQALAVASEILTLATAFLVHPAGELTEESQARRLTRLNPVYSPVTSIVSLTKVLWDGTEKPITYRRAGNSVQVHDPFGFYGSTPLWRTNWHQGGREHVYRLTYRFGSTITPAARQAVIDYAHELWLMLTDDDECALPERVTAIDREGLGITLATPQDFLDKGRIGLPKIDTWLSQVNSRRAYRPSGVYTPDAPPGVGVAIRRVT